MAEHLPRNPAADSTPELTRLLEARDEARANSAWDHFLNSYGPLLLRTAKFTQRGHDAATDAYAYVLERLRQDGFRRLRAFSGGDRATLSRWLVVVSRRLCLDFRRERYGRPRASTPEIERDARRRLVDGIWEAHPVSELAVRAAGSRRAGTGVLAERLVESGRRDSIRRIARRPQVAAGEPATP